MGQSLHLFNISHFSSTFCAENSSFVNCPKTMAKRMQEQKKEVWQNPDLWSWTCLQLSRQVPHPRKIWLHQKARGHVQHRETWKQDAKKFETRRSVEFSSEAERCKPWRVNSEHPPTVVSKSRTHSIFTHFPKDRHCDVCLRTKITKASCKRRTGEAVPRAEVWWLDNG